MTNFETVKSALKNLTHENALIFKNNMKKVGSLFSAIKNECSEDQLKELEELLTNASSCTEGLAKDVDSSGFLGMNDDELFAILFLQKLLDQIS